LNGVKLVDGKFASTGKPSKAKGTRPPKYPYPQVQYDALLALAKADGLDVGDTRARNTNMVNTLSNLILDDYVGRRQAASKKTA